LSLYRVSRLRFLVQSAMLICLVYLGVWGVRRLKLFGVEPSLPTLSCEYGDHIARCYLYDLQMILTRDSQNYYRLLIEPTLFFVVLGIVGGRMWCGWVCPLGFLQDLLTRLRCRLRLRGITFGSSGRRVLRGLAYALLASTLFIAVVIGWPGSRLYRHNTALFRPYCQLCPSRQLTPLIEGKSADFMRIDRFSAVSRGMSLLSMGFLGVFIVGAFCSRRLWCRLCALGALMSIIRLNKFSLPNLKKDRIAYLCQGVSCGPDAAISGEGKGGGPRSRLHPLSEVRGKLPGGAGTPGYVQQDTHLSRKLWLFHEETVACDKVRT